MSGKKRIRKELIFLSGKTEVGKPVLGGVFKMVDAQGISLEIVLEWCKDNDFVVDWMDFIVSSITRGWNWRSTKTKIEMACATAISQKYADAVMARIALLDEAYACQHQE